MLLSLRDITLQVNGVPAFEHTNWEIRQDEHWAILGPTGAGKTLLAQAISRRVPLFRGRIDYFFDEQPNAEARPYIYPQEILTLSAETHRSFLARFAGYHQARWQSMEGEGVPSVRELFLAAEGEESQRRELARLLQLDHLLDLKVMHLSHGESRKAHLAFLLLKKPKLLILDDPFAGLDEPSRVLLTQVIEEVLQRETPQLLLISSRVEEIPAGVHRVLLVDALRVQAMGARDSILAGYRPEKSGAQQLPERAHPAFEQVVSQFAEVLDRETAVAPEMVRMEAVSVNYGAVGVLKNLSWCVKRGERWALSGPNGAGKTTLLSLILGDNPQSYANDIFLFGRRRGSGESIWEIKKNIGWVSPELHIHYPQSATCFEVVRSGFFDSVGLYRNCTAQQIDIASGWLDAFGLSDFSRKTFQSLSSGQQRQALLARALVKEPPLLILDEPCQGLDAGHRESFIGLIDQICRNTSLTMIYVTHYQAELPGSITHCLRLRGGEVLECGPKS